MRDLCSVLYLLCIALYHSCFAIVFMGKRERERASVCTLIVFLMSCDCKCFVALPRGAVSWSAVCNSGIS